MKFSSNLNDFLMNLEKNFTPEALAGLASKEDFSAVKLRKRENSCPPPGILKRDLPYKSLMLILIKGLIIFSKFFKIEVINELIFEF